MATPTPRLASCNTTKRRLGRQAAGEPRDSAFAPPRQRLDWDYIHWLGFFDPSFGPGWIREFRTADGDQALEPGAKCSFRRLGIDVSTGIAKARCLAPAAVMYDTDERRGSRPPTPASTDGADDRSRHADSACCSDAPVPLAALAGAEIAPACSN